MDELNKELEELENDLHTFFMQRKKSYYCDYEREFKNIILTTRIKAYKRQRGESTGFALLSLLLLPLSIPYWFGYMAFYSGYEGYYYQNFHEFEAKNWAFFIVGLVFTFFYYGLLYKSLVLGID